MRSAGGEPRDRLVERLVTPAAVAHERQLLLDPGGDQALERVEDGFHVLARLERADGQDERALDPEPLVQARGVDLRA